MILKNLSKITCKEGAGQLSKTQIQKCLKKVFGWELKRGEIQKLFTFKNYYETVSFVNAAAWIAHKQNHHPEIEFGYKNCTIRFSTHSVSGLTENDFICAAQINALFS